MDTQSIIALLIVAVAVVAAFRMLVLPFVASLRPQKKDTRCAGGCGCGHEERGDEFKVHGAKHP